MNTLWKQTTMLDIWKDISGYPNYQVSESGQVRRNKNGLIKLLKPQITSKGYARITLHNRILKGKHKKVHRLVAVAFLGDPPDDKRNHVNHKDGVKLNNHYTNLEWVTLKENLEHAMNSNLITRNIQVRVYDTVSGSLEIIPSIGATASRFNIGFVAMKRYLGCYPDLKFNDRFLFEPLIDEMMPSHYPRSKTIVAYDYVTRKQIVAGNLGVMTLLTGVANTTIETRVVAQRLTLIGGYVFKYLSNTTPFPEYSVEEAKASREVYLARRLRVKVV